MTNKKNKLITEFRKDLVSGEWILISSGRKARPVFFEAKKKTSKNKTTEIKNCPFENPQKSGNPEPILCYPNKKDWFLQVVPNKYPIVSPGKKCPHITESGPYSKIEGVGSHEVIITRDHNKTIDKMSLDEIELVIKAFQARHRELEKEECIEYILIFHNQGELAGASLPHPHSQLIALPIIPPDVFRSITGGLNFFKKNKKCVHCTMLKWEMKEKKRIIFQNKYFVTIAPFASRVPYETRIFPIKHESDFEAMPENRRRFFAEGLKDALVRINKALKNPDYNFFIHTASARVKNVPYYHWHLEILPRTYKWAGVELGTGIDILHISPEEMARHLRQIKNK